MLLYLCFPANESKFWSLTRVFHWWLVFVLYHLGVVSCSSRQGTCSVSQVKPALLTTLLVSLLETNSFKSKTCYMYIVYRYKFTSDCYYVYFSSANTHAKSPSKKSHLLCLYIGSQGFFPRAKPLPPDVQCGGGRKVQCEQLLQI